MQESTSSPLSEDSSEMKESGNEVKGSHGDSSIEMDRKLYGLFIVPVIFTFAGIFCGYIRHILFDLLRKMIRMVDNYMLSVDQDIDIDQTPVKVLDTLNSLSTIDHLQVLDTLNSLSTSSSSELLWDDSIERNAQDIVRNMSQDFDSEENANDSKDKSHSSETSIINIDFGDYFQMIQKNPI